MKSIVTYSNRRVNVRRSTRRGLIVRGRGLRHGVRVRAINTGGSGRTGRHYVDSAVCSASLCSLFSCMRHELNNSVLLCRKK